MRRNCRSLERRYRRTFDPADEAADVAAGREKNTVPSSRRRRATGSERINTDGGSPTKLWRLLTELLRRDERTADAIKPTCNDADDLLYFYEDKVKAVHASTESY